MESVQIRHPTCWDPPGNRSLQDFDPYDPPPTRQPSCWEPPPHRTSQGYSDYDQPPPRPPSCWDPPRHRTNRRCPLLPVRRSTCEEQPSCLEPDKSHPYQPDRSPYVSRQPRRHHLPSYQPPPNQPTDPLDWQQPNQPRRSYHPSGEPQQFDQSPSHHTTMLPAAARTRSGSMNLPQKSRQFRDSRQQRGLPNNPELMVRSLTPVQQAALDDYNEKLRIYRMEQAALLARVNALFEENIDDNNLVEDVPNNAANNGGANLDVPNDEAMEEIVKTDNTPLQVLVGAYDEKIGEEEELGDFEDSILETAANKTGDRVAVSSDIGSVSNVAIRLPSEKRVRKKKEEESLDKDEGDDSTDEGKNVVDSSNVVRGPSKNDVWNSWGENEGAMLRKLSKDSLAVDERKFTFDSVFDDKSGDLLDPTQWEFEIKGGVRNGSALARIQRPCIFTFDPGGDKSPKLLLSTLLFASWFPP